LYLLYLSSFSPSQSNIPTVLTLVQSIKNPLSTTTTPLYAPSFDHALKDPIYNDIPISPTTRIVIFEGLYLSLNIKPWSQAAALMDELW
jgi:pantothenate kinase